jgi:hypothetical protein
MSGFLSSMVGATYSALPAEAVTNLGINWNGAQYTTQYLQYAGADSNNKPVFMFSYKDTSDNYVKAVLVRVDSATTFTRGTPLTILSSSIEQDTINCCTESPDASQYWVTYATPTTNEQKLVTGSYDLSTLTLDSPGTAVNVSAGQSTGLSRVEYAGNNRVFVASRQGEGQQHFMASRSSNTITMGTTNENNFAGDSVNHVIRGAGYNSGGSGLYRYIFNTFGGTYYVGYWNGTTLSSQATFSNTAAYTAGQTHVRQNSAGTKWVCFGISGGVMYVKAVSITWPTSGTGAPTVTQGTTLTLTDTSVNSNTNNLYALAPGFADDECYVIYRKASDNIFYRRKLTTSGNTITEGAATALTIQPTNPVNPMILSTNSAATASGNYIVSVIDNSGSSDPNFIIQSIT